MVFIPDLKWLVNWLCDEVWSSESTAVILETFEDNEDCPASVLDALRERLQREDESIGGGE